MIESKFGQRLSGVLLIVIGGLATAGVWRTALNDGYYFLSLVILMPSLAVMDLGPLLFPIDMDRLRADYGIDKPEAWEHYPLSWKIVIVLAVAAALANWYAIAWR